jgi:hypothetical protein
VYKKSTLAKPPDIKMALCGAAHNAANLLLELNSAATRWN